MTYNMDVDESLRRLKRHAIWKFLICAAVSQHAMD